MKTSNIILTSITSSITLIIVIFFMELRFDGIKRKPYNEVLNYTVDLRPFRYLAINESLNLKITASDNARMLIYSGAKDQEPQVIYHERGDTLYITQMNNKGHVMSVTLEAPVSGLEWIRAQNAHFSIREFPMANLSVDLDDSTLKIFHQKITKFGTLSVLGTNRSSIYANNTSFDTLRLNLNQTKVSVVGQVKTLEGSMVNHSSLFAKDIRNFAFRKDSTSQMY